MVAAIDNQLKWVLEQPPAKKETWSGTVQVTAKALRSLIEDQPNNPYA
jgi:hypothetical protein